MATLNTQGKASALEREFSQIPENGDLVWTQITEKGP